MTEDIDPHDEPEPEPPTDDERDAAFIAAEDAVDDDSDLDDTDASAVRRSRLTPLQDRVLAYLRDTGDEWQLWPEVVEAVQSRPLAEISPLNGRVRQAALRLAQQDKLAISYGDRSIFAAVRLLPAGYEIES